MSFVAERVAERDVAAAAHDVVAVAYDDVAVAHYVMNAVGADAVSAVVVHDAVAPARDVSVVAVSYSRLSACHHYSPFSLVTSSYELVVGSLKCDPEVWLALVIV